MEKVFEILKEAVQIADTHDLIKNQDYLLGQMRDTPVNLNKEYATITFSTIVDKLIIEDFVSRGWIRGQIKINQDEKILLKKQIK